MSMAIDGLVSGLDTTSLINSLMQVEAAPQTLLKNKVSATQGMISALQGLNSKVAELATLAAKTAKPTASDLYTATSSSTTLTASVGLGATAGSIDVVVDRLAQSQVSLSDPMLSWPDTSLTITAADGTATTITAASTSLDDVVSAINSAGVGVAAIKVAAGTDPGTGQTQYRVQLTAAKTGADGAFTVSGTAATLTEFRTAQDAQVTLWGNTPITSTTNTFSNLLPGVSVTVSATSVDPITVTVARDDASISSTAKSLVDSVNGVLAYISTKTAVTNSTDASGAPKVSGGVFTGESTVRDVEQRILSAASAPVNGKSPSEFGISITRDGTMEFDADKFAAALAADPTATQAAVQEISSRLQVAAAAASDKYDGQITSQIKGRQGLVTDMNNQIEDWDGRLATRRASLERTYSALEVQLSKMNSQSSWLTSQLAGLPTSGA
ncbi:flagellar filament capping protein FliD [Parafrigoribacterium mesophilum]|uniref:flagellar filament capping protein FliD n=1 Tax=Parafrigoribacterium mesophilum TaxID=433646 RepID=UPI0031FBEE3B